MQILADGRRVANVRFYEDLPHWGGVRGGEQNVVRSRWVRREASAVERREVPSGKQRVVLRAIHAHSQERRRYFN